MNLNPPHSATASGRRRLAGIALVVTLLMLSVITFLTIAFLAMTRRNQADVSGTQDLTMARAMGDAAAARAQGEILAQMLAHNNDPLYYDYMVSRAFINPNGFALAERTNDPNNVNYDFIYIPSTPGTGPPLPPGAWVQNIANLWYDPRAPVFVLTNPAYPTNLDFRFWVDISRNGRFETNGYQPTYNDKGLPTGSNAFLNGEPEFIGVLRNPLYPHSATNPFVGRYAYLVLPIGKECDLNYVGNDAKADYMNVGPLTNAPNPGHAYGSDDGFARDQGVGSWELNLAGLLDALSPWAYESNDVSYHDPVFGRYLSGYSPYNYWVPTSLHPNTGNAFGDAAAILHYRDWSYTLPYLQSLRYNFTNYAALGNNGIDYYCVGGALNYPFDYSNSPAQNQPVSRSWPGSYSSNNFFDPQDLFDPAKTSVYFTNRMLLAGSRTNSFDRYTFERLISCLGMGSSPEYGVWVYKDNDVPGNPTRLCTKVNINYDNTAQITNVNAPYAPMPTNLVSWTPLGFFTNAAELLLRSQGYVYGVYTNVNGTILLTGLVTNFCGVTNIPIYRTNNPGIRYDAAVHRMLQLAANIYDATNPTNNFPSAVSGLPPVRHPSVFRPLFQIVSPGTAYAGLNISGYALVTSDAWTQIQKGFQDVTNAFYPSSQFPKFDTNGNVAGIPWVVAANKGLPEFYHYTCESQVLFERKLKFPRYLDANNQPETNQPPASTNQFYCFGITNSIGLDAWNSYSNAFYGASPNYNYYYFSNYVTIQLTNWYGGGIALSPLVITSSNGGNPFFGPFHWSAAARNPSPNSTSGFVTLYKNTNIATLPAAYYSEYMHGFYYLTNGNNDSNSFLQADMKQTGWPAYNWTLNVTNHLVYALFDGSPRNGGALLDFVNLGPFGSSLSLTQVIASVSTSSGPGATGSANTTGNYWAAGNATSLSNSPMSAGMLNQITNGEADATFLHDIQGNTIYPHSSLAVFDCPCRPTCVVQGLTNWVANDPLVHYTLDDLIWMGDPNPATAHDISPPIPTVGLASQIPIPGPPLPFTVGMVSARYAPWGARDTIGNNMLFKDPLLTNSIAWQFPTNKFPGVGWIGRVHRGTPWQTVYLKADTSANPVASYSLWSNWANPTWLNYPNMPETYPTRDWPLVDVFTTAPNDNAARGLLSVNQTNDAAWAAVFAGVIVITNGNGEVLNGGTPISVGNALLLAEAISQQRRTNQLNQPNGLFHHIGDILQTPALTTPIGSPFLSSETSIAATYDDEAYERIPQQVLSLLKVGEPQFAIFAWGQSLRPKGPPYLVSGPNMGIYTNYQITGEYLSRTVCHLVHTNGLKMVIDSYNVEPGN